MKSNNGLNAAGHPPFGMMFGPGGAVREKDGFDKVKIVLFSAESGF
jgi:hypothetical protein